MPERFIDEAWIKGDFKKATISASQSALTDSIWFIKYPFALYAKFKPQKPSISFFAGTKVHGYFQQILQKKMDIKFKPLKGADHFYENYSEEFSNIVDSYIKDSLNS